MEKIEYLYSEKDIRSSDRTKNRSALKNIKVISKDNKESIDMINDLIREFIAERYENELKVIDVAKGSKLESDIYDPLVDYLNSSEFIFKPASLKAEIIRNFMLGLSGYGILEPLMEDDEIEDIYIYAPDKIYYLKNGLNYI